MRAGIDVGGTFTDLVLWDGALLRTAKVSTTSGDQSEGVIEVLRSTDAVGIELIHGTTVATNALLERTGARTALVTDSGFEDLIEIGRQDRPSLYDVTVTRVQPLVESSHRVGVPRRSFDDVGPGGLDVGEAVAELADLAPDAVAISTLFSFLDPSREQALGAAVSAALPEAAISLSSTVAPEFREFERTSTTVINAYLQPTVARYLDGLGAA
ncbi:MAG: hydantoinase/oxoprolinase N-terminal domain-containing protein, partial [Acidimicrobiia bacterium]